MVTKAQAGYVYSPRSNLLCGECVFLKEKKKCAWMGASVIISPEHGGCNVFKEGNPDTSPWLAPYMTKVELGYLENGPGFGCRRCEEFRVGQQACKVVDKTSPGATPGKIDRFGCCDFWEKDAKRGSLSNDQLVKILSAPQPQSLKAMGTARAK